MAKAQNKTKPTEIMAEDFIASIDHPGRRADGMALLHLFNKITELKPKMWGVSIIGYGRYAYKYQSGHEGEYMLTGFSPRKAAISIYILPGYRDLSEPLSRLGKYKTGKSCLYINKLADIDMAVLEEIVQEGLRYMRKNYRTWDE